MVCVSSHAGVHAGHVGDEVQDPVGVPHLIVVPRDELHEVGGERDAGLGVHDAR